MLVSAPRRRSSLTFNNPIFWPCRKALGKLNFYRLLKETLHLQAGCSQGEEHEAEHSRFYKPNLVISEWPNFQLVVGFTMIKYLNAECPGRLISHPGSLEWYPRS